MNNLTKLFGISVMALALSACGGSDRGTVTKGDQGSNGGQQGGQSNNQDESGNINGLYKAFTTCERTGATDNEQALFERLCGQHNITFTNTGNKGVLRFHGAMLNWDKLNTGLLSGYYTGWQNFYLTVNMKGDEGLGLLETQGSSQFQYKLEQLYMNVGDQQATYSFVQHSDTHYVLTVSSKVDIGTSPYFPETTDAVVTLDVQLGSSVNQDRINGTIKVGEDATVTFNAQGKPAQNDTLFDL